MIRIVSAPCLSRPLRFERWVYLGKEADGYRRAREQLGAEKEWPYGERLREVTEELRQPFLDFVAEVGACQRDPITWWSTRFSWKVWGASDLFLLVCYLAVAESLMEEAERRGIGLGVVVEDPWLLRQLRENLQGRDADVHVQGKTLLAEYARSILVGVGKRAWWLYTVLRNRWRQGRLWPQRTQPVPEGPAVGIFSYPSRSTFQIPDIWSDFHLPQLDQVLADQGCQVIRFSPPECGGWEKELAGRSSYAYPLILWATGTRVVRSLGAFWRPRWPEHLQLKGWSIRWLCRREGWMEIGRSSLCTYRLFYECLNGMLSQGSWRYLIAFYENQPWEKLQVLSARAHGVKTVGIQTTHFSRYHLSYALGRGEEGRIPLPDWIGTSGPAAHQLLLDCGIPAPILRRCGALRYGHLVERLRHNLAQPSSGARRSNVLVVLSIDPVLSRHLLEALHHAFPDGGRADGLHFTIRPHPMHPIPRHWVRFPCTLIPSTFGNFQQDLESCGLMLFTASTVGFEALAEGKPALRYRSPRLFDLDDLYGSFLPVVTDSNLREMLLTQVQGKKSPFSREETLKFISDHFAPVDWEALAQLFCDTIPLIPAQLTEGILTP